MKKCKKLLSTVLTLALVFGSLCSFPVETAAAETDIAAVGSMGYTIKYSVKEDGSAQVTSIDCLYGTDVVIPAYHNGHPVTSIGTNVINNSSSPISGVEIPDTVTRIENGAFQNCGSLKRIDIPDSVTYIGDYAFENCSGLKTINLSDNIMHIGLCAFEDTAWFNSQPDGYLYLNQYLFGYKGNSAPGQIEIKEGTLGIAPYALSRNMHEGPFVIPDSVKWIGDFAFAGTYKLSEITIPKTVTSIGVSAFKDCYYLEDIILEEGNPVYDSRDNCHAIIETETNTLIAASNNTVIPSSVTSIGDYAFSGLAISGRFDIPNTITRIGDYAFKNIYDLSDITIPDSVTSVGRNILEGTQWYRDQSTDSVVYAGKIACSYEIYNDEETVIIRPGTTVIADGLFENSMFLKNITIPDTVKVIGKNAFKYAYELTNVDGAASVTEIGDSAFDNCMNLESFTMPDQVKKIGNRAFYLCSKLNDFILPDTLVDLGSYAFYRCDLLTAAVLPDGIKRINDGVFAGCSSLSHVIIPDHVTVIGERAFAVCSNLSEITIPENVRFIGNAAFQYCSSVQSFNLPKYINSIGDDTFYDCRSITSLSIPDTVQSIGDRAFLDCAFSEITLPDSIAYIGEMAFTECGYLKEINIPKSVVGIGVTPFFQCHSLRSITVDVRNPVYDSRENCNAVIRTADDTLIAACRTSTIPNTVKKIGKEAFRYGRNEHITLPDSIEIIDDYAFMNSDLIGGIELSDNIASIGKFAFSNSYLQTIRIPNKVTEIHEFTFAYCSFLSSVFIPTSVESIEKYAFSECDDLVDVYYAGSQEEWESIRIGSNNDPLINATFHFNYELVEKTDEATGIAVRGYIADDDLRVDTVSDQIILNRFDEPMCEILGAFDIELYRNEQVIRPSHEVTVKIPTLNPKIRVFRYNNRIEPYFSFVNTEYADGYLVFTTRDLGIYAIVRDPSEEIIGDPDGDDDVTIMDATVIQRYLADLSVKAYVPGSADADGDGDLTIMDATAIQRYLADLPTNPDIGFRRA